MNFLSYDEFKLIEGNENNIHSKDEEEKRTIFQKIKKSYEDNKTTYIIGSTIAGLSLSGYITYLYLKAKKVKNTVEKKITDTVDNIIKDTDSVMNKRNDVINNTNIIVDIKEKKFIKQEFNKTTETFINNIKKDNNDLISSLQSAKVEIKNIKKTNNVKAAEKLKDKLKKEQLVLINKIKNSSKVIANNINSIGSDKVNKNVTKEIDTKIKKAATTIEQETDKTIEIIVDELNSPLYLSLIENNINNLITVLKSNIETLDDEITEESNNIIIPDVPKITKKFTMISDDMDDIEFSTIIDSNKKDIKEIRDKNDIIKKDIKEVTKELGDINNLINTNTIDTKKENDRDLVFKISFLDTLPKNISDKVLKYTKSLYKEEKKMGTDVTMDQLVNDYIEDRLEDLGSDVKHEILKLNDEQKSEIISKILELPMSDRLGKMDLINDYFESIDKETHIKNSSLKTNNNNTIVDMGDIENRLIKATMKKASKDGALITDTKTFISNLDKDSSKIKTADDYKKVLDKITDKIVEINNINTIKIDKKSINNISNSIDLLQKEYKRYKTEWDAFKKISIVTYSK